VFFLVFGPDRLLALSGLRGLIANPIFTTREGQHFGIGNRRLQHRAQKVSGDELGVLVDRFNEMLTGIQSRDNSLTKALKDREEALRDVEKATERFRFLAKSMPQKIFNCDTSRRCGLL